MAYFAASSTTSLRGTSAWPGTQIKITIIDAAAQARCKLRGEDECGDVGYEIALSEARELENIKD